MHNGSMWIMGLASTATDGRCQMTGAAHALCCTTGYFATCGLASLLLSIAAAAAATILLFQCSPLLHLLLVAPAVHHHQSHQTRQNLARRTHVSRQSENQDVEVLLYHTATDHVLCLVH